MGVYEDLDPNNNMCGQAPLDANNQAVGPYAYFMGNPNGPDDGNWGGINLGAGLMNGTVGSPGNQASMSILNADLGLGEFVDPATGTVNYGADANANLIKFGMAPGNGLGPIGFDVGVANADAGAYGNSSDMSVGAEASLINGAVTVGGKENSVRVGASLGVGLAGRLHYGDTDHDGVRELGFGVDVGPLEFDVKSEMLGKAWNGATSAASSVWDYLND